MDFSNFTTSLSKKLTLAISSVLFIWLTEWANMDISLDKIIGVVSIVVTYLAGQSWIDVKKESKLN